MCGASARHRNIAPSINSVPGRYSLVMMGHNNELVPSSAIHHAGFLHPMLRAAGLFRRSGHWLASYASICICYFLTFALVLREVKDFQYSTKHISNQAQNQQSCPRGARKHQTLIQGVKINSAKDTLNLVKVT
jgi:cystathionine beta-lyase family protein involved in aluminum resistance